MILLISEIKENPSKVSSTNGPRQQGRGDETAIDASLDVLGQVI
jgi:hypothetical protein